MGTFTSKIAIKIENKLELSSAKLSSLIEVELSWGWVELKLSWVEVELSWGWAGVEIESLQLKYLKSCSILLLSRLGGWVVVISEIKPQSWSWSWVELSWGWAWQKISNCINLLSPAPTYQALTRKFFQDMSEEKFEQKQPKRSEAKGCKILCCNNENINQVLKCQDLH